MKSKKPNVVVTSAGVEVAVKAISAKLLEMFDASHVQPEPPLMEAEAIGGLKEMVPNPDDPAYQKELREWTQKASEDFVNMILDMGTDISLPEDDSWKRKLKRAGIVLPDDEDELRLAYMQAILMPSFKDDLRDITAAVLRLSGASEEAIASWVELF